MTERPSLMNMNNTPAVTHEYEYFVNTPDTYVERTRGLIALLLDNLEGSCHTAYNTHAIAGAAPELSVPVYYAGPPFNPGWCAAP